MKAMSLRDFDKLQARDFENGAVQNEIRLAIKQRQDLLAALGWTLVLLKLADSKVFDSGQYEMAVATFREAKAANA